MIPIILKSAEDTAQVAILAVLKGALRTKELGHSGERPVAGAHLCGDKDVGDHVKERQEAMAQEEASKRESRRTRYALQLVPELLQHLLVPILE